MFFSPHPAAQSSLESHKQTEDGGDVDLDANSTKGQRETGDAGDRHLVPHRAHPAPRYMVVTPLHCRYEKFEHSAWLYVAARGRMALAPFFACGPALSMLVAQKLRLNKWLLLCARVSTLQATSLAATTKMDRCPCSSCSGST